MSLRVSSILALAGVCAAALYAANDPFVGTWTPNLAKSKLSGDQWKIEELGQNRFRISSGETATTITADGTDQPFVIGMTESITVQGPRVWNVVFKKDGKVQMTLIWSVSDDGKVFTSKGTESFPDGKSRDHEATSKRVGTGSDFAGTWEQADFKAGWPSEFIISSYQGDGLTFHTPVSKSVQNIKFDGKEYPETGPLSFEGSTSSGKRVDANTIELVDTIQGKVLDHAKYQVSPDGKSLTVTIHNTGQSNVLTIVYEKN